MQTEYLIRRMTVADIDRVCEIDRLTFAHPWTQENYLYELKQNPCARYLVLEAEGTIVGFAGGWIILDESHVTNIGILKDYRGNGYGKAITRALLQYFSNLGASYTTLEVRKSNMVAQHVYTSLGFVSVGVRKKYYTDTGEDGLIMVCDHLPEVQEDFVEPETVFEADVPQEDRNA
ncbi:MAG: ribosomal protein S18-alanine N-acetyltransferase [Clostridia bacterium]|nr:ribosomal protein S18-alanine N-acetyltransferase [Clostridia bacterium]